MNVIHKIQFNKIKTALGISDIISIRFSDSKSESYIKYCDTACTALARSLIKRALTYIDRMAGQMCSGGDFFLNISRVSNKKVCDTYVKDEKVFKNNASCLLFLKNLPKYPKRAKKRYILFTPLDQERAEPDVVAFLATPAQAGRILGLSVYEEMRYPMVIPALSTCALVYVPIVSGKIHINFIDYFDRYYQGRQNKKLIWKEYQLIISMPYHLFKNIVDCILLSAHGNYRPKIKLQKVDLFN